MKGTVSIVLAVTLAATSAVGCGKRRTYKPMLWLAVRLRLPQQEAGERTKIQLMGPWVVESPEDQVLAGVVKKDLREAHPEYESGTNRNSLSRSPDNRTVYGSIQYFSGFGITTNGANNAAWKEMGIVEDIRGEFDPEIPGRLLSGNVERIYI